MTTTPIDGDRDKARTLERAVLALEAHRDGETWATAADRAGYTDKGTAYRAVMRLLGQRADVAATELRADANGRHAAKVVMLEDVMYDLDRPMMERLRAADVHTRVEARHARLNGLDAPVQVQISAGVQAELSDALAELAEVVMGQVEGTPTDEPVPDAAP